MSSFIYKINRAPRKLNPKHRPNHSLIEVTGMQIKNGPVEIPIRLV